MRLFAKGCAGNETIHFAIQLFLTRLHTSLLPRKPTTILRPDSKLSLVPRLPKLDCGGKAWE